MPDPELNTLPLSAILRGVAEREAPTVSIDELMELFGGRALGALLLVFGLAHGIYLAWQLTKDKM